MDKILEFLKYFGVEAPDTNSNILVVYAFGNLVLSLLALFCIINILIYFLILKLSENQLIVSKIEKHKILFKLFVLYKNTRRFYIIVELFIFTYTLGCIIWLSWNVLYVFTIK